MREIPHELWAEVLSVVTDLTWNVDDADTEGYAELLARLRAIYLRQETLGKPEPFLTEALADYTPDPEEAVGLYRLALAQCSDAPEEPTHTKRICMASLLIDLGDREAARTALTQGRAEAERAQDSHYVEYADELLSKLAV